MFVYNFLKPRKIFESLNVTLYLETQTLPSSRQQKLSGIAQATFTVLANIMLKPNVNSKNEVVVTFLAIY